MRKSKVINSDSYRQNHEFFFKVAMKYFERKQFNSALKYLDKAIGIDPGNAYYRFNLACILSEQKEPKKSNEILFNILKEIDPTLRECYFGIGYNFFDMGDFKKSKEFFEKYVYFSPDGEFIEDAYDILYYLKMYDDEGVDFKNSSDEFRLINEAKKLLDAGEYKKASKKLERLIEKDPEHIYARINLSMAYFLGSDSEKAVKMAKSILKLDSRNIFAHCNLALFYESMGKKGDADRHITFINRAKPGNREELLKLIDTLGRLNLHNRIAKLMIGYLKKDVQYFYMHILAISLYNIKEYDEAFEVWKMAAGIFPQYNLINFFYNMLNLQTKNGERQHVDMQYTQSLPDWLTKEYSDKLESLLKLQPIAFKAEWDGKELSRDILVYYMFEGDKQVGKNIVSKLLEVKDKGIEEVLKSALKSKCLDTKTKSLIKKNLK